MTITRRFAITGIAALPFALSTIPTFAQVRTISSVRIDVSEYARRGAGPFAGYISEALKAELVRGLQGRMGNGPALVVRVKSLAFNDSGNSDGNSGGTGGGSNDYLEGEVLARYDILSPVNTQSGNGNWSPQADRRRIATLAQHNAGWTLRYVFG
jgi:hypothetical protein